MLVVSWSAFGADNRESFPYQVEAYLLLEKTPFSVTNFTKKPFEEGRFALEQDFHSQGQRALHLFEPKRNLEFVKKEGVKGQNYYYDVQAGVVYGKEGDRWYVETPGYLWGSWKHYYTSPLELGQNLGILSQKRIPRQPLVTRGLKLLVVCLSVQTAIGLSPEYSGLFFKGGQWSNSISSFNVSQKLGIDWGHGFAEVASVGTLALTAPEIIPFYMMNHFIGQQGAEGAPSRPRRPSPRPTPRPTPRPAPRPTPRPSSEIIKESGKYRHAVKESLGFLKDGNKSFKENRKNIKVTKGKFGDGEERVIGFEYSSPGGKDNFKYRIDHDPVKGHHINVEKGAGDDRQKTAYKFEDSAINSGAAYRDYLKELDRASKNEGVEGVIKYFEKIVGHKDEL